MLQTLIAHRNRQGLVPVAKIHRTPDRGLRDRAVRPRAIRQLNCRKGPVLVNDFWIHRLFWLGLNVRWSLGKTNGHSSPAKRALQNWTKGKQKLGLASESQHERKGCRVCRGPIAHYGKTSRMDPPPCRAKSRSLYGTLPVFNQVTNIVLQSDGGGCRDGVCSLLGTLSPGARAQSLHDFFTNVHALCLKGSPFLFRNTNLLDFLNSGNLNDLSVSTNSVMRSIEGCGRMALRKCDDVLCLELALFGLFFRSMT